MSKNPPPDRLSNDPASDFFDAEALQRGVGVRFKERERDDVEEYCLSEGWIRVQAGKAVDRRGMPVTVKLSGPIETWWRDEADKKEGDRPARDAKPGSPKAGHANEGHGKPHDRKAGGGKPASGTPGGGKLRERKAGDRGA